MAAFFAVISGVGFYLIYRPWTYGEVPARFGRLVGYATDPLWFLLILLVCFAGAIAGAALAVAVVVGDVQAQRALQKRQSRPPLDDAIREPKDR